jgi:hypothetical protein
MRICFAAIVVALLAFATACTSEPAPAPAPAPPPMRTVTLGATGPGAAKVTYTCIDDTTRVCGPDAVNSVWTKKVTAPVGTTVRVQVSGGVLPPECWISDETDQMTYSGGPGKHVQDCSTVLS